MPKRLAVYPFSALGMLLAIGFASASEPFQIGWESIDMTPRPSVAMRSGVRSTGVLDPVTATALVLEQPSGPASQNLILISCDLQHITDGNRYPANMLAEVRKRLSRLVPQVPPERIVMMATHTHVAPSVQNDMDYLHFASERIAKAAQQAWQNRQPGGISFGLGHAVVGHNRIATYRDGTSHMVGSLQQGSVSHREFSHLEGFEDHSVHLLYTWDLNEELTGVVINVPCPAQVQRGEQISADYWHEVREELRQRLGPRLQILPQLSAAGDLATTVMVERKGEARMQALMFPELSDDRARRRRQIAVRICDAVTTVLPYMQNNIDWQPSLAHAARKVDLPRGFPQPDDTAPPYPAEIHAVRLGEIAMVTNPFELYLDYGIRIKGRSPAVQTFVIQLAGSASYLPTRRAVAGGGYGAIPRTSVVGPDAGDQIVATSLELLDALWRE